MRSLNRFHYQPNKLFDDVVSLSRDASLKEGASIWSDLHYLGDPSNVLVPSMSDGLKDSTAVQVLSISHSFTEQRGPPTAIRIKM